MAAFDIYTTHLPSLAACVARTTGPVLELGMGEGSTPFLHYACRGKRLLVSAEYDHSWAAKYEPYGSPDHLIYHVRDWHCWDVPESRYWDVAFLDLSPGEERAAMMPRLANRCRFLVIHDTERDHGSAADYKYEQHFGLFQYRTEMRRFRPYTMVLSNVQEFVIEPCDRTWTPPA